MRTLTGFQEMEPTERQLFLSKVIDLLLYNPTFCAELEAYIKEAEELGCIRGQFTPEKIFSLETQL